MQLLISYIFVAMLSWVPIGNLTSSGETEEAARARLHSIAEDIVTVALDEKEPPVFARADGRVKTAILQAAIPSLEGGYQKFVDQGDCNQRGFRADRRGNCDGGYAFSLWQIHVTGGGYIFLEDGALGSVAYARETAKAHPEWIMQGKDLIADRKNAVRVAQRLERYSLTNFHSLCAYSGEPCGDGEHPKAKARLDRAMDYYAKHPFTSSSSSSAPEPVVVVSAVRGIPSMTYSSN